MTRQELDELKNSLAEQITSFETLVEQRRKLGGFDVHADAIVALSGVTLNTLRIVMLLVEEVFKDPR